MNVSGTTTVLQISLNLSSPAWVLVESDGRYYSGSVACLSSMSIAVDSAQVGNSSIIDWSQSTDPVQHSYNVVGAIYLSSGSHSVVLTGTATRGNFNVGAGSNLIAMVNPAPQVSMQQLGSNQGPFGPYQNYVPVGQSVPHTPFLSQNVSPSSAIVALASASMDGADGDVMLGIYLDGQNPGNGQSLWTINDTAVGAEPGAPLYTHAFLNALDAGSHTVSFDASSFPWLAQGIADPAVYDIEGTATLVTLQGGFAVAGSAPQSNAFNNETDWIGVASSSGSPAAGTDVLLSSGTFNVPAGHSGVVLFIAKSRVQGNSQDTGESVFLWLVLDGQRVGAGGVQQLNAPNTESQRTICASYLSAGSAALTAGPHTVEVHGSAQGTSINVGMVKDLPLLWVD